MTASMTSEQYRNSGKESVHQRRIITIAKAFRWTCYHTHYALGSDKGYPDITLVHPDFAQTLWIEVKGPKGRIHPEQVAWLARINEQPETRLGIVVFPPDIDAVEQLLQGNDVDIYEDEGVLRVRLLESDDR